ncbi:hypothetical protein BJ138DRAFT_1144560 [Hygrophoropsis aurantiaca]|uniref:Uncharacterized protein n=1 Tax=Hygrophoropsis aurantiaca TaxID=72124 RepID=A0ACB8AL00_9AGAM|nr:hypothetical protein BJ138DRAFT_1144560 [Hygrophoropsis aurantiaca]
MKFLTSLASKLTFVSNLNNVQSCKFKPDLDTFYHYTSGYWLCNDKEHRAARSVTFNVPAFCRAAAEAVGAKAVIDMVKINESLNRVFLVRFDTGREAIARFPTPLAGPPHFTTASEVATMDFLRRQLAFPIPRVLAWSSRAETTDVGAEFILMEKAPGCLLSGVWKGVPIKEKVNFAEMLGKYESQLLDLKFTHYGSLYYKDDVPPALRAPTLLEDAAPADELNSIFCIGPMARRDYWEAERETMDIDRGPWRTPEEYMTAVASREQAWISRFGTPHILDDPNRVLPDQGDRADHVSCLSLYTTYVPFLVPAEPEHTRPIMWHPDLHASNIFIAGSESGKEATIAEPLVLSAIIDWQGTCIGPAFLQLKVPPLFRTPDAPVGLQMPSLPDNFETLEESQKEELREKQRGLICHKVYEAMAFPLSIVNMKARKELIHVEDLAQVTWKYGLIPFRMAIYRVWQHWEDVMPGTPVPDLYSAEVIDKLEATNAIWLEHNELMDDLAHEFGLGEFGLVKGDWNHFEKVRAALEKKKLEHVAQGKDEEAKMLRSLLWPYRDTLSDPDVIPRLTTG